MPGYEDIGVQGTRALLRVLGYGEMGEGGTGVRGYEYAPEYEGMNMHRSTRV